MSQVSRSSGISLAPDLDVLTRDQIERLRDQNLATAATAIGRHPVVSRSWPGIAGVSKAEDLGKLPLFGPDQLYEMCPPGAYDLVLDSLESGLVLRSSGTVGRRKVFYHSWAFHRRATFLGARGVRRMLPHGLVRVANCLPSAGLGGAFMFAQDVTELLDAVSIPLGNSLPIDEITDAITDHAVDTLVAMPGFALELLSRDDFGKLDNLLFIGEPMGAARQSALADRMPRLTIRSLGYSTNELGPIGYQCPRQENATHHIHEDAVVVEVVDTDTGEPVPDGRLGEIVVSTISDTGMPLFRYRTGDKGCIEPDDCACGSSARQLTLCGRIGKSITVGGQVISQAVIMAGLRELGVADAVDAQFHVLDHDAGFAIRILLSSRLPRSLTTEEVIHRLRGEHNVDRMLAQCADVTVEYVEPTEFFHTDRGKTPFFVANMGGS